MKVITIGRSSECSVVINDVKVSRVHAQLVQDDNGNISVVDLGSTNGTKVNGKRITGEMRLNPGDELRVGDTVLPWQNYIATVPSQTFQPIASNTQSPATAVGEDYVSMPAGQPGNNKNTLLWIILAMVLGLLITGGVVWLLLGRESNTSETNSESITNQLSQTPSDIPQDSLERALNDLLIQRKLTQAQKDEIERLQRELNNNKNTKNNNKDNNPADTVGKTPTKVSGNDAKTGVSTNSPDTRPVPTMQTPQQQKNELQKVLNGINDEQKLSNIYNDCYDIAGGERNKVKKITGTSRTRHNLRSGILALFDAADSDTKTRLLNYVKNNL